MAQNQEVRKLIDQLNAKELAIAFKTDSMPSEFKFKRELTKEDIKGRTFFSLSGLSKAAEPAAGVRGMRVVFRKSEQNGDEYSEDRLFLDVDIKDDAFLIAYLKDLLALRD